MYETFIFVFLFIQMLFPNQMDNGKKKVSANLIHKNVRIVYFCDSCRRTKLNVPFQFSSFIRHVQILNKYDVVKMCELARYDLSTIGFELRHNRLKDCQ